jgi:hypothetical protein
MESLRTRTAATNLGGVQGYRPLEGKLAVITGASRGILLPNVPLLPLTAPQVSV